MILNYKVLVLHKVQSVQGAKCERITDKGMQLLDNKYMR